MLSGFRHKLLTIVIIYTISNGIFAQKYNNYQKVNYHIVGWLDSNLHYINAEWSMEYLNLSSDTLHSIFIEVWPNAYLHKQSELALEQLRLNKLSFNFASKGQLGGIKHLNFRDDTGELKWQYQSPIKLDIIEIFLNEALHPGDSIIIKSPFILKVPDAFLTMGRTNETYRLKYWYPRAASYSANGWQPKSYNGWNSPIIQNNKVYLDLCIPSAYKLISNGIRKDQGKTDNSLGKDLFSADIQNIDHSIYRFSSDQLRSLDLFLYKAMDIYEQTINNTNITIFADSTSGDPTDILKATADIISHLEKYGGNFPQHSISIVIQDIEDRHFEPDGSLIYLNSNDTRRSTLDKLSFSLSSYYFDNIENTSSYDEWSIKRGLTSLYQYWTLSSYAYYDSNLKANVLFKQDSIHTFLFNNFIKDSRYFDQSICSNPYISSKNDYQYNFHQKPGRYFNYLVYYIGDEKFKGSLSACLSSGKVYTSEEVQDCLHDKLNENIFDLLQQMICSKDAIDLSISLCERGDSLVLTSNIPNLPVKVTTTNYNNHTESFWVVTNGIGLVKIPRSSEIKTYEVDREQALLEINTRNNTYDSSKSSSLFSHQNISWIFGFPEPSSYSTYLLPLIGYNQYNGIMTGFTVHNISLPPRQLEYYFSPFFGFNSSSLVGIGDIGYHLRINNSFINSIRFGLHTKSFYYRYSSILEKQLRYLKLTPSIEINLKSNDLYNNRQIIKFRSIQLWEQNALEGNLERSHIHELSYTTINFRSYNPFRLRVALEQQNYTSFQGEENYLKIWAEWESRLTIDKDNTFRIRAFAGTFLINTHQKHGFITPGDGRGNFSLFGNSALDYRYDQNFIGRNSLTGIGANQISISDGGFKNAITRQFSDGITNRYLLALNLSSDLPQLPKWLPIRPYFDAGYTAGFEPRQPQAAFDQNLFWSGGLGIHLINNIFNIYFPLLNSDNIERFYNERGNFWTRISFSWQIGLNRPADILRYPKQFGLNTFN